MNIMLKRLTLVLLLQVLAGCVTMRSDPERPVGGDIRANYAIVRVHFATDRNYDPSQNSSERFGSGRDELRLGVADVAIPRNHKMGELEKPAVWRWEFRFDPEKHVTLLDATALSPTEGLERLRTRIANSPKRQALVFVHGYNVTFEDAARRTAQLSYDLGFDGAPVLYSWPSNGNALQYLTDEASAQWSVQNLVGFLESVVHKTSAQRIFLVGHSMGGRVLAKALSQIGRNNPDSLRRFAEVILAAPDIDSQYFRDSLAPALVQAGASVTLYASSEDQALRLSSRLRSGYPRAGESGNNIVVIKGIETIDAVGMGTDFLNHSYAIENRSIISDIFALIQHSHRASERPGLILVDSRPTGFWRFRK